MSNLKPGKSLIHICYSELLSDLRQGKSSDLISLKLLLDLQLGRS